MPILHSLACNPTFGHGVKNIVSYKVQGLPGSGAHDFVLRLRNVAFYTGDTEFVIHRWNCVAASALQVHQHSLPKGGSIGLVMYSSRIYDVN